MLFLGALLSGLGKEGKKDTRGSLALWGLANILLARGAHVWGIGMFPQIFLILVSFALYLMLRQAPLPFLKKEYREEIAKTGLVFLILLLGVYTFQEAWQSWALELLVICGIGILIYEQTKKEEMPRKQSILIAAIGALILAEITWIMSFLPLHPISFSAGLTLTYLTLTTILKKWKKGDLNVKTILQEILIFTTIMLLILSTTSWDL